MRILLIFLSFLLSQTLLAQAVSVEIVSNSSGFSLERDGQVYDLKGAGGSDFLGRLSEYGGNSMRTWGTDEATIELLDSAHSLGLTVCMGLWVGHQEHGFDYNNERQVQEQFDSFKHWVETYKDHPAVLFWALGNEVELGVSYDNLNLKVWDAINDLSKMVHEVDGNHPTLTVTAGISQRKARDIMERASDLDLLGVNCYGCIGSIPDVLSDAGWEKPYVVTEWGPNGQWESPETSWDATFEMNSTEKAKLYFDRYIDPISSDPNCVGSYVFLWSSKFEETPTWYGLFFDGYETEAVDVMKYHWSGQYPANRAPVIKAVKINGETYDRTDIVLRDEYELLIEVDVEDENMSSLNYQFLIQPETGDDLLIDDGAMPLPYIPGVVEEQNGGVAVLNLPKENFKNYRLFYFITDDDQNIALGNIPFRVQLKPLESDDPSVFYPVYDAYVRDGNYSDDRLGIEDVENLVVRNSETAGEGFLRETYLRFDFNSVTTNFDKATLELYGGGTEVRSVVYTIGDKPWNEPSLTWNKKYDEEDLVPIDTIMIKENLQYHSWDVTDVLRNYLARDTKSITFVLRNIDIDPKPTYWSSRETRPNPPRTVFDFNGEELVLSAKAKNNEITIFPNPTSDKINISGVDENANIQLYSLSGKIIKAERSRTKSGITIETSGLIPGIYILKIGSGQNERSYRLRLIP